MVLLCLGQAVVRAILLEPQACRERDQTSRLQAIDSVGTGDEEDQWSKRRKGDRKSRRGCYTLIEQRCPMHIIASGGRLLMFSRVLSDEMYQACGCG